MKEEVRSLVDKARRYLRSAEVLRSEGDHDSACSRLYYAMFYCAEAILFAKSLSFSSHKAVISSFGQHLVKPGELPAEMHAWLREGFDLRQAGDYDATSSLDEADAQGLQSKAEQFVQQAEDYLEKKVSPDGQDTAARSSLPSGRDPE